MNNTIEPIVVEQTFNVAINKVWSAITEVDEMRQWFFKNIDGFKAEVGFKTQFNVQFGELNFLHLWEITEADLYKKITYNWKYDGYKGNSFVVFELVEKENETTLKVIHKVVESFPNNIPEFTSESCLAGWKYFIQKNLKTYLEKTPN